MNYNLLATFGEIIEYVGYIALAILVLLIMITIHELGHYIAGKIFKFGIEEFAIGFGPKIFSKKLKSGENFSIRLLPVGGFCAFTGEDESSQDPNAFNNKKPWQRIIVLISGALMNYILALVIIVLMFSVYGQTSLVTYQMQENPAYTQQYSFAEKDVVLKVEGKNVYMVTDLMNGIQGKKQDEVVKFTVIRNGKICDISVKLRADANFKNVEDTLTLFNSLGIYYQTDSQTGQLTESGLYSTSVRLGFFSTIGRSFEYSFKIAGTIFSVLGQLLTGQLGLNAVGGTVTTVSMTATAIQLGGFRYLLNIASFIGVNLAVFNLLPIPALDGSRVVFTAIEWIRKKPINRRVEGVIHTIGFVLILLFAIIVDLQQCI